MVSLFHKIVLALKAEYFEEEHKKIENFEKLFEPTTSDHEHNQIFKEFMKTRFGLIIPDDVNIRVTKDKNSHWDPTENCYYLKCNPDEKSPFPQGGSGW